MYTYMWITTFSDVLQYLISEFIGYIGHLYIFLKLIIDTHTHTHIYIYIYISQTRVMTVMSYLETMITLLSENVVFY